MKMVPISLEIPNEQARAYAEFLKRVGFSDYQGLAKDETEAYTMQAAGEKIKEALARNGFVGK